MIQIDLSAAFGLDPNQSGQIRGELDSRQKRCIKYFE